jgi:hypothetical protein
MKMKKTRDGVVVPLMASIIYIRVDERFSHFGKSDK